MLYPPPHFNNLSSQFQLQFITFSILLFTAPWRLSYYITAIVPLICNPIYIAPLVLSLPYSQVLSITISMFSHISSGPTHTLPSHPRHAMSYLYVYISMYVCIYVHACLRVCMIILLPFNYRVSHSIISILLTFKVSLCSHTPFLSVSRLFLCLCLCPLISFILL